jgi:hypothetical protein
MKYAGYQMDKLDYLELLRQLYKRSKKQAERLMDDKLMTEDKWQKLSTKAGNLSKKEADRLMDDKFMTEMTAKKCHELLIRVNNLTDKEVNELIDFEFGAGPISVPCQVRYQYLRLKAVSKACAEWLDRDTKIPVELYKSSGNKDTVKNICFILAGYIKDFVIFYKGQRLTVNDNQLSRRAA